MIENVISIYLSMLSSQKKVIFDFGITDKLPIIEVLIQLFKWMINRFMECKIQKIVSDDYKAIIGAVKSVFPEVTHFFCVFHQSKNINEIYIDEFKCRAYISDNNEIVCNEINQ